MMCSYDQVPWIMFLPTFLKLLFPSASLQLCTCAPPHLDSKWWGKGDSDGVWLDVYTNQGRRGGGIYRPTRWKPAVSKLGKHSRKSYSHPRGQGRLDKSQRLEEALVISQSALLRRVVWHWRVGYRGWNDNSEMNKCLPCAPGSLSQHPAGRWKDDCRHRDKMENRRIQRLASAI